VILVIATGWGRRGGDGRVGARRHLFHFFFLAPAGTFTIADPQNWVAFVAFLITAIVTSQLSGRARRRTIEALDRQRDLERLYALSRSLLLVEEHVPVGSAFARHVADAFQLSFVAVYDQQTDAMSWAGPQELRALESTIRDVARRSIVEHDRRSVVRPVQLGGTTISAIAIPNAGLSDTVSHSLTNLVAIGIERARSREATARAEAAQQSGELRTAVLDALAHEFKTPLTSMKAASGALVASATIGEADRETRHDR
jgi:two-component system sensor histidine kinase KdpD